MVAGPTPRWLRLSAVASALVITTASAGQSAPNPVNQLAGRWELRGRWASDAVSAIIELAGGGWYTQTLVASARLHYEYNGADLTLTTLNAKGEPDSSSRVVMNVVFDADTLTATSATDTIRMVRAAGGDFAGDIKGRWLLLHRDKNQVVTQEFQPDGFLRVMTTLSGEVGRFRLVGDQIEWSPMIPLSPSRRTNYKIENEKLVLWSGKLRDELIRLR